MAGRNALYLVHSVLIASAIALAALLLVHGLALFSARHDWGSLVTGILAAVVGAALAAYLLRLSRRPR